MATSDVDDVREVLSYYRKFDDPIEAFRLKLNFFIEGFLPVIALSHLQGKSAEVGGEQ